MANRCENSTKTIRERERLDQQGNEINNNDHFNWLSRSRPLLHHEQWSFLHKIDRLHKLPLPHLCHYLQANEVSVSCDLWRITYHRPIRPIWTAKKERNDRCETDQDKRQGKDFISNRAKHATRLTTSDKTDQHRLATTDIAAPFPLASSIAFMQN